MIQTSLQEHLDKVAARYRLLRFWQAFSLAWLIAALCGLTIWYWRFQTGSPRGTAFAAACFAAAAVAGAALWLSLAWRRDYLWVARQVETAFPELESCVLAAIEQRPNSTDGRYGYLQISVIRQAVEHAQRHPWQQIVPSRRVLLAMLANLATFILFVAVLVAIVVTPDSPVSNLLASTTSGQEAGDFTVAVEPGDAEIERGASLLVLARVQGAMPAEATLVFENERGEETRLPMPASLDDPVFGGRIPLVEEPLAYHVELGGQSTPIYRVTVFEYPRLERADAHLTYPSYTGMEPRLVQDVRTLSAVEGTKIAFKLRLNKPVVRATLIDASPQSPGENLTLTASPDHPLRYEATLECRHSRAYTLDLVDDAGRKNVQPTQFKVNVLPNLPPTIKPIFPARDLEVSPLEELDVKANAWDDFGLARLGLTYALAGQPPVDVVLLENGSAKQKHDLATLIALEKLAAEPDQLLSYHWWAEDFDRDGELRRTMSDMYFAEVRPFEEIFRQGEQPPGGQQQQQNQQGQSPGAQQAQELAKLQKEIINATWKVVRREVGRTLSEAFATDAEQIHLSQAAAKEQAGALAEKLQDEQSQQHLEEVLRHMDEALNHLKTALDDVAREPLSPGLAAEQAAYQSLLRLRAREHEVVRQQRGQQSGSQSASRSQQQRQQLDQLELKEEENRYETQRMAQDRAQESAEERENRQVLSRLRELARRQHDLNERLKELQSALEEARTEEQKEEIQRQLKRLQDEQRQILQDTDELQSRLDQPENAQRMSEERQQLEETRDEVRRASEALERQQATQAAAAGSRAERQFDELREEFRRRASQEFGEDLNRMRQAARELEQREIKLAEGLQDETQPKESAPTLRDSDQRGELADAARQQRERLAELQNQMRDTIERAEETEPLIADKLYESARDLQDQKLDRALESIERSVRQGLLEDARQQEAPAGQAIRQLREGIDKAAESVLGDETEALRRAREELRTLSRELNEEIKRNAPGQPSETNSENPSAQRSGGPSNGDAPQQEQPPQSQPQPGRPQPDQPQQSQQQPGQQRGQSEQGQPNASGQNGSSENEDEPRETQSANQPGERSGQPSEQPSSQTAGQSPAQSRGSPSRENSPRRLDGNNSLSGGTGPFEDFVPRDAAPIAGQGFRDWSDRLRDVEEMVNDPDLRAEAARIRERARAFRAELKRHSAEPNWDLVRVQVAEPLVELEQRVAEELLRRTSKQAVAPLDRDPVPPGYTEKTRRYYERLGSGK